MKVMAACRACTSDDRNACGTDSSHGIFAYFVVFNLLGKSYDAAVMTSGFCGFGMGATPNAMANMQAITAKYGPAPTAYFVVPLVGSLFIDFFNALIITTFMNFL